LAQVSIIILNWNGRAFLETCLPAVLAQTHGDFEVVLVDNGSDDGSVELVQTQFPLVRLIQNAHNLGFAAGNNQAIRATTSEFVATLNNDARPEPDWLATLVAAMASAPRVGMCASKMLFADRPHVINSAGLAVDRAGIAWDRCGGQRDGPPGAGHEQIKPVFGASAGAALYRRAMLDQVGLFDETFFAYLEDVDLAWRAQMAGWEALYVPQARVYHHHSATAGAGSAFKRRLLGRNKAWLILKNYPTPALLRYLPAILVYDWIAVAYTLLVQRDLSALQGRLEGLRRWPHVLRQRRRVQTLRTRTSAATVQRLEPLVPPWRVWRRFAHLE
jgi:hypothetical protein